MNRKYIVELTALAQQQILQLAQYIIDKYQEPETADRVVDTLETEITKLDTMPERVVLVEPEPWHSKGVHKYIIGNYIAYFIIVEPEHIVRVTAVVLDRRNQKRQLKQMEI